VLIRLRLSYIFMPSRSEVVFHVLNSPEGRHKLHAQAHSLVNRCGIYFWVMIMVIFIETEQWVNCQFCVLQIVRYCVHYVRRMNLDVDTWRACYLGPQFGRRLASHPWAKRLWANRPWGEMSIAGRNIHGAKSPDTITCMSHVKKLWLTKNV